MGSPDQSHQSLRDEFAATLKAWEDLPTPEPTTVYNLNQAEPEGENLEDYEEHGLHPVEIDQIYGQGKVKYRIVHKLGNGGSSTVWLGQDVTTQRLFALKFLTARASAQSSELRKTLWLNLLPSPLSGSVVQLRDNFRVKGPNCRGNSTHQVLVFDLLGPSVAHLSFGQLRMHARVVQEVMLKTTHALKGLHEVGIVHLDLTPSNVVLRLKPNIASLSVDAFNLLYGHPFPNKVRRTDGKNPRPQAPLYSYGGVDFLKAPDQILPEPVIIDFSESCKRLSHRQRTIPPPYAAPEALLENRVGFACDVWSLGCLIFYARSGQNLFPGSFLGFGHDETVLSNMISTLGQPPLTLWRTAEFNDDDSIFRPLPLRRLRSQGLAETAALKPHWLSEIDQDEEESLRQRVYRIWDRPADTIANEIFWGSDRYWTSTRRRIESFPFIDSGEADLLYDLLSRIFVWDPKERITAAELIDHPWFQYGLTNERTHA